MTARTRVALLAAAAALALPATAGAAVRCTLPPAGKDFERAVPGALDLAPAAVREAIDFATLRNGLSVRVYRHGCLAGRGGLDPLTENVANDVWSTTKGVVSVLAGRAQKLGYLHVRDPIGRYLPEADAAHARITVRQLLTETSGLHFIWTAELHPLHPDSVAFTLGLPFDHEPGSFFEYGQLTVNLLAHVIERAVGQDLQDFAQRELFGPLGIERDEWLWLRDSAGHTHGWAHLLMSPRNLARVGHLMLRRGRWRGRGLLGKLWTKRASAPSPANPGYGYLLWPNRSSGAITPSIPERRILDHRIVRSAPPDMYAFIGFGDQIIFVIPSLDMVIVRTGLAGNHSLDPQVILTANTGDWMHEFFRLLMRGVRDHRVPDPGPFSPDPASQLDLSYFVDVETIAASLGVDLAGLRRRLSELVPAS